MEERNVEDEGPPTDAGRAALELLPSHPSHLASDSPADSQSVAARGAVRLRGFVSTSFVSCFVEHEDLPIVVRFTFFYFLSHVKLFL